MITRYPHLAKVELRQVTTGGQSTGIIGKDTDNTDTVLLKGRFENKSGFDQGYTAKFYAKQDDRLKVLEQDSAKLYIMDRSWDIVRIQTYQTHTEIWLN